MTYDEHYRLTLALTDADLPEEARALRTAAASLLGELSEDAAAGVRELAREAAAHIGQVSRG
ncbi:hypothetical protein [Streptomyces griseosporeus]|uniref:hypothetical protein n=1 Tax=Streptomyces griseosporeus TaxID=1910 RepID=UPI00167C6115|nr:hypothetical protein [Streptomyces griseosporeus]GHF47346.1 hypothetical protein GCM10018783_15730 [Streptomyces griseosporeus]